MVKFDKDGFPVGELAKNYARKHDLTLEELEIRTQKLIKLVAAELRNNGVEVPTDPQEEAEFVAEVIKTLPR